MTPDRWSDTDMAGTSDRPADGCFAPDGSGVWYCKRRQLLRELPKRARTRLEAIAERREFQTRDLLFTTAGTEGRVHLLIEGRVRLVHFDEDGGETQLAVLEPGEAFFEPAHGEVEPIDLYAEAIEPGCQLSVDSAEMVRLALQDPGSFEKFVAALGEHPRRG